ncbi:MAG: hypothetical protein AAF682_21995 [Planctomycetota bacterium]
MTRTRGLALGTLDAAGAGAASVVAATGTDPALAGLVLSHAYAVIDAFGTGLEAVSNPVSVELVP